MTHIFIWLLVLLHAASSQKPAFTSPPGFDCQVAETGGARKLSKCVAKPGALSLNLDNKGLDSIAAGALDGLTVSLVDLSGNALTDLPDNLFAKVLQLQTILLDDNKLSRLRAKQFTGCAQTDVISAQRNQIVAVDAGVFSGAPSVTTVKLCANQIETIDAKAFAGVKGLKRLELCNNVLATMPASFQDLGLGSLETVDLSHNVLKTIPASLLARASQLRALNLRGNKLDTLPKDFLAPMKELRRLDLSDNKLTTLSGVTLAGVVASGLTHALTELDLSGNAIAAIDKALFAAGWDKLTTLRLSSNGISSLGEGQFAGLSQLTDLYLDGNFLTALPPAVFSSLPALLSLNLASNQIAEIGSGAFKGAETLILLDLSHNKLSRLANDTFAPLSHLRKLDVSSNEIAQLVPGVFMPMSKSLSELYLHDNKITALQQDTICCISLARLSTLAIRNNPLACCWLHRWLNDQYFSRVAGGYTCQEGGQTYTDKVFDQAFDFPLKCDYGRYTEWSEWTCDCDPKIKTPVYKRRTRDCTNPPPLYPAKGCNMSDQGSPVETGAQCDCEHPSTTTQPPGPTPTTRPTPTPTPRPPGPTPTPGEPRSPGFQSTRTVVFEAMLFVAMVIVGFVGFHMYATQTGFFDAGTRHGGITYQQVSQQPFF